MTIERLFAVDYNYSTALRRFPKESENRKTPISYGFSYKFTHISDLQEFLIKMGSLIKIN